MERNTTDPQRLNIEILNDQEVNAFIDVQNELNQKRIAQGEMVVTSHRGISHGEEDTFSIYVAQQRPGKGLLIYGPVELFDWFPAYLLGVFGVIGILLLGGVGYLLVRPLESGMKQMESAIDCIRKGDLSARVFIDTNDAIGNLASTINEMAEHIQRLIKSQREMTNAVSHELRTPVARLSLWFTNYSRLC